ncbi:hypothetical protein M0811_09029 [Anaeramoeba ignava]|uniref:BTB domain-containing protein n=1 Tax=Anaeramoeba ignava TaxID=1746090 RepID=A0A9Q0RAH3_ANAIG|nr:hypothetical protein M0811_09029 [Anaeramoeba ignava]
MDLEKETEQKLNDVWFLGRNSFPDLIKNPELQITTLFQVDFFEQEKRIIQIAMNWRMLMILFENGRAFEYYNDSSQTETKIQIENIQKISVGTRINAVLTKKGEVFARGNYINSRNQKEFINVSEMIEFSDDKFMIDIVCGADTAYLLSSQGNVYAVGDNHSFEFGCNLPKESQKPICIKSNVYKIFSSGNCNFAFFLSRKQKLYGCGRNDRSQLGLGKDKRRQMIKMEKIENVSNIRIIEIKTCSSYSVIFGEDEETGEKKLYLSGITGIYPNKKKKTEEFIEFKSPLFENDDILQISVGNTYTFFLTSNRKLFQFWESTFDHLINNKTEYQPAKEFDLSHLPFDIFSYQICGITENFFLYSSFFSNLEDDLNNLLQRKEFCDISFKTENGEIIEAHKLILKYRLNQNQNQNQIEKLQEIISKKSIKESNQIFEMIYSNRIINPKLYSEIKEIINESERIEETMKRIYLNENEKDFTIEKKEKKYKFPKLILIMRSELYRGMFLSVTEDDSNKVTDYSELSNESFEILEYWIYTNQIKEGSKITKEILEELERGMDYFQLNPINPNIVSSTIDYLNKNHNNNNEKDNNNNDEKDNNNNEKEKGKDLNSHISEDLKKKNSNCFIL